MLVCVPLGVIAFYLGDILEFIGISSEVATLTGSFMTMTTPAYIILGQVIVINRKMAFYNYKKFFVISSFLLVCTIYLLNKIALKLTTVD